MAKMSSQIFTSNLEAIASNQRAMASNPIDLGHHHAADLQGFGVPPRGLAGRN